MNYSLVVSLIDTALTIVVSAFVAVIAYRRGISDQSFLPSVNELIQSIYKIASKELPFGDRQDKKPGQPGEYEC